MQSRRSGVVPLLFPFILPVAVIIPGSEPEGNGELRTKNFKDPLDD